MSKTNSKTPQRDAGASDKPGSVKPGWFGGNVPIQRMPQACRGRGERNRAIKAGMVANVCDSSLGIRCATATVAGHDDTR